MSYSYLYLLSIWIQILQLSLSKKKKIQNTKLLLPKNIKRVILWLSHVQKGKKKTIILTTYLYSNILFLFVFVIYLNSNTEIIFIKQKINKYKITYLKKKKLTTSRKNYSFLSWNFYGFFFFYSLKHFKIFVIQNSIQLSQILIHP